MILYTFLQLLPILFLTVGGFVLSRIFVLNFSTLVVVITDFLMPLLIFYALYTSNISGRLVADIAGATTLIVILLTGASYLYVKLSGVDARSFMPPILFMNSGFLGIPLMQLWGGLEPMNLIVIYDQIQTVFLFTLGILIITGGFSTKSLSAVVKSPILWAVFAGFGFRFFGIPVAEPILAAMEFGGSAAPPLAAVALGVSLRGAKFHLDRHVAAALLLRFVGGFFFGWVAAQVFGLTGMSRTVVIVAAALPSAVFTSVLPHRYGVKAEFAGTVVVATTVLAVITIPITFWLAV